MYAGRGGRVSSGGPGPGDDFSLNAPAPAGGMGGGGGKEGPGKMQSQQQQHTKYNTFADMGIQGKTAEKEECVVM